MNLLRWRLGFAVLFLACTGMIGFALYHQFYQWLMPCLMCVYERIAIIGFGLFALIAVIRPARTRSGVYLYGLILTLWAGFGAVTGIRHTWMQYGPKDPTVTCASSLPFPIDLNALPSWISAVIRPVGDCANIDFLLFGITMPIWITVASIGLIVVAWYLLRRQLLEIRRNQWR
ncbi:disulfide bond formation protein B [Chitinibacter bivalviorum]|uniref:Disulfide bond formation protein B n=1 Tax=Chitinibacter bivalviorum TaxID=2739434 RepID=A0A7H9BHJ5_9NEIS|nr:disulfide bond formation protein B [Chitinibacter bivalviorum]QLG88107.1 disulfide bond formation protein B [Chitinibacter bivalviorum]